MLILFEFFILILNIESRIIDLHKIKNGIVSNITKINFDLEISGTNEYIYKFEIKNIFYNHKRVIVSNKYQSFTLQNPNITILFNLLIYENNSNSLELYSYPKEAIISDKNILVNINFEYIKYFKQYNDFSFNMTYQLNNFNDNISIYYDNLKETDLFNYLIYNQKSILYDNETLYKYSKKIIFKKLIDEMYRNLIYYPECDQLIYFKSLYDYFFQHEFKDGNHFCMSYFNNDLVSSPKITGFLYDEIVKEKENLIFKNLKIDIVYIISFYDYYKFQYENEEKGTLYLDYFKIEENLNISFGASNKGFGYEQLCYFDLFQIIINKTIIALK